jgi:hypothetical protein
MEQLKTNLDNDVYTKLLIARYSPSNGCYVRDDAVLSVTAKKDVKQKDHVSHYFVDSESKTLKSRYGWVKTVESFRLDDFLRTYEGSDLDDIESSHIKIMLRSIQDLPDGTPVAATYSQRGLEKKEMAFTVHKVFFHT